MLDGLSSILLIDGATGTELERRGVDLSGPIWSAAAIESAPDVLEAVHRDYLRAGARAVTACTFRTQRRALARMGRGSDAAALTHRAVEIALVARDAVNPEAQVLGSVAPLEACYRPELAPDFEHASDEHAEIILHLLEAGVDGILIETMNTAREAMAAAGQAARLAPGRWMISFCTKSLGPPGFLLSGEPLADLMGDLDGASAVGVNCVAAPKIEAQIKLLRHLDGGRHRLMAYGNIGYAEADDHWVTTDAVDPERYAGYAAQWIEAGASIVGGCCGTKPASIAAIAAGLRAPA